MPNREYPDLPFVPPRAYGSGRAGYAVQYVVVHYTAGSERATSAEDGAAYDQRRTDGTSTHYFVDQNSIVQCVYTWDRANACYFYGNRLGIQYELCGTVQSRAQWLDPASDATLANAARQIARDCAKYGLPVRRLTVAQMRNGEKGICGHVDVTNAYGLGDHTDPGPQFPWDVLLARVQQFLAPTPTLPRRNTVATVYYNASSKAEWALAGDSPGTPANWLTTADQNVANAWAAAHGNAVGLYQASYDEFRKSYTAPLSVVAVDGETPPA
jgi:hypothetical protein